MSEPNSTPSAAEAPEKTSLWKGISSALLYSIDARYKPQSSSIWIDWMRSAPYYGLHLACIAVIWVGWSWAAVAFAVFLYWARMFAITGFYHRYFSHRTFRTSRAFQFVMAVWGLCALQRGPLWWASHHRHHHRHSDEPEDVHSPRHGGFFWSHMGWVTSEDALYPDMNAVRDLSKYPELTFLDRYNFAVYIPFGAFCWGVGALAEAYAPGLGMTGAQSFVWGFIISTIFCYHGTYTINSFSHLFGHRPYETSDDSRNNWFLAIITMGEGWHNNHHYYPGSVQQGFAWYEYDPTHWILRMMSWVGLIWNLNGVPEKVMERRWQDNIEISSIKTGLEAAPAAITEADYLPLGATHAPVTNSAPIEASEQPAQPEAPEQPEAPAQPVASEQPAPTRTPPTPAPAGANAMTTAVTAAAIAVGAAATTLPKEPVSAGDLPVVEAGEQPSAASNA